MSDTISSISIIRKIISLKSNAVRSQYPIKIRDYEFTVQVRYNSVVFGCFVSLDGYKLYIIHRGYIKKITIDDEFIDSDDISLILKYGRWITDDSIVEYINECIGSRTNVITIDDLQEFFDL